MPIIIPLSGSSGSSGGSFDTTLISNSAIFDGSNDFLSNAFGADTDRKKAVVGCWLQRLFGGSSDRAIFSLTGGSPQASWAFKTGEELVFFDHRDGAFQCDCVTTIKFRDYGWYHLMASWDTTESAAADRFKMFLNGTELTLTFSTSYDLNDNISLTNSTTTKWMSGYPTADTQKLAGYLTQAFMLDNQSIQGGDVAVSDILDTFTFGTNGSQIAPKADADIAALASTAGGDSHMLSFDDSSDLGNDESSNNNDFSVTGLASGDQTTNTPSSVLNTLNPLIEEVGTLSNGNRTMTGSTCWTTGNILIPVADGGKWYYETVITLVAGFGVGFTGIDFDYNTQDIQHSTDGVFYRDDNRVDKDGSTTTSYGSGFASGDRIGCELDLDNNEVRFYNGSKGSGSQNLGTISKTWTSDYIVTGLRVNTDTIVHHFASSAWTITDKPTADEISSANVTAPANQGIDFFKPVLYTGNGTAIGSGGKSVTGVGFESGFSWIKNRDATDEHMLFDRVRTATKFLESSSADAEATEAETLSTFDSDGFTLGNNVAVNTNTEDYVSWNWKAASGSGTTTSPAGSLASTSIVSSANSFSVVSYTGTGSATTVGHGLGKIPDMILIKNRDQNDSWSVFCDTRRSDFETDFLVLNTDAAESDDSTMWNDTLPTSSVFSIGTNHSVNANTEKYVAYCFANTRGVVHASSYVGNANDNGPLVFTGFKPSFVMIKQASDTGNWFMYDTVRSVFNVVDDQLEANTTTAETTGSEEIDILSNGFKVRTSDSAVNQDTHFFVYLAMGEIGGGGTLPPIYSR